MCFILKIQPWFRRATLGRYTFILLNAQCTISILDGRIFHAFFIKMVGELSRVIEIIQMNATTSSAVKIYFPACIWHYQITAELGICNNLILPKCNTLAVYRAK